MAPTACTAPERSSLATFGACVGASSCMAGSDSAYAACLPGIGGLSRACRRAVFRSRADRIRVTAFAVVDPGTFTSLSTSVGFLQSVKWNAVSGEDQIVLADVDGDGRADLVWMTPSNVSSPGTYVGLSTGVGFGPVGQWSAGAGPERLFVADVDGDGRADRVRVTSCAVVSPGTFVALSTGTAFSSQTLWSGVCGADQIALADADGDGRADLVRMTPSNVASIGTFVSLSTGTAFQTSALWNSGAGPERLFAGDVDGDGRADRVRVTSCAVVAPGTFVALSTGTSFSPQAKWSDVCGDDQLVVADADGDGRADLVRMTPSNIVNPGTYVSLSTGAGFQASVLWNSAAGSDKLLVADVDGW